VRRVSDVDAQGVSPLADLLLSAAQADGRSLRACALAGGLGPETVRRLVRMPITRSPREETIAGLARGFRVAEGRVRAAVAASLGLHVTYDANEVMQVAEYVAEMPPEVRHRWTQIARSTAEVLLREHESR
jgi:hypothetical protein